MINQRGSAVSMDTLRRPAFYAVVIAALAVFLFMLRDQLPMAVTAWYEPVGPHRVHDLNFFALVWLGLLGIAIQLYRPGERVTAVILPVLVMGPLALMAVTSGSPIAMLPILFTVIGVVVVALHPAGLSVVRFDRNSPIDRGLLGLVVVAAIPLTGYAATELSKQYTISNEHAVLVHYGGMALLSVLIVVLGLIAAVRRRDWRFPAWCAGVLAVYLGASSAAFPGYASSVGPFWGGLSAVWGVGFVAAVEVTRGRSDPNRIAHSTVMEIEPTALWDLVNDFDRMTEWVTFADELTYLSDGEVGEGTVYREYGGVGPISSESEWEIIEFEPPSRQVHRGDLGIMQPELTMTFEPVDGGTKFTQSMTYRALPRGRPLGWLLEKLVITRSLRSGLRETQSNLKRLAETGDHQR